MRQVGGGQRDFESEAKGDSQRLKSLEVGDGGVPRRARAARTRASDVASSASDQMRLKKCLKQPKAKDETRRDASKYQRSTLNIQLPALNN